MKNSSLLKPASFPLGASKKNLKHLILIRFIVLAIQCLAVLICYTNLKLSINYTLIVSIILLASTINLLTVWRNRKNWPVTNFEFLIHLLVDIVGLSSLLYLTGGANNPFVSYFLVPICISAALLPSRYTWITTAVSLACYSVLLQFYIPLTEMTPTHGHSHDVHGASEMSLNLHIFGMWLNFGFSAIIITYFVVRMAFVLRQQNDKLNIVREDKLRDEQILAIATLAAGTAHELGTPLSTMAILLKDMENEYAEDEELKQNVALIQQQVSQCKSTLRELVNTANTQQANEIQIIKLDSFINDIINQWSILRPEVKLEFKEDCDPPAPTVKLDATLNQALLNVLNNAADACPDKIETTLSWSIKNWSLIIRDYGPGIPLDIADQLGQSFIKTKGKGLGIGLILSHASIARLNGTISRYNHSKQGTITEIQLPLDPFTHDNFHT